MNQGRDSVSPIDNGMAIFVSGLRGSGFPDRDLENRAIKCDGNPKLLVMKSLFAFLLVWCSVGEGLISPSNNMNQFVRLKRDLT